MLPVYLPVKRIGNKFLVLPGDNNGYTVFWNGIGIEKNDNTWDRD
jgi:hypothetical protein